MSNTPDQRIAVSVTFRSQIVGRAYRRTFKPLVASWSLADELTRKKLRDDAGAEQARTEMLSKLFARERRLNRIMAVLRGLAQLAELDGDHADDGSLRHEDVEMSGLVATKYMSVLLLGDQILALATTLFAKAGLPKADLEAAQYEVRRVIHQLSTYARDHRFRVLQQTNAKGLARRNFGGGSRGHEAAMNR